MIYNLYQMDSWVPDPDPKAAELGCGGWVREQTPAENEAHALYVFMQRHPSAIEKYVKIRQL
jgi:hypothetical protein